MLRRSTYSIPKMDCPSEERLIRMALDGVPEVETLEFDLEARSVDVIHRTEPEALLRLLVPLNLGVEQGETRPERIQSYRAPESAESEGRVLCLLLAINAVMFVIEVTVGWYAQSTGLMADGLDMLADAGVYGLSLYAVGRSKRVERRAARISGYGQLLLGGLVLMEVGRRAMYGSEPLSAAMMLTASVALIANLLCVALLHRHREGGLHMRASWIFSTNDAIANLGVIVAGGLVFLLHTPWPDLVIGTAISLIVLRGAVRILRLSSVRDGSDAPSRG